MKTILHRTKTRLAADNPLDWQTQAACKGMTELFFPEVGKGRSDGTRAKHICWNECPVQQACLDYALSYPVNQDDLGIWGGYSAKERRQLRRHGDAA